MGTASSASSVERMIVGRTTSTIVNEPVSTEYPSPRISPKKIMPKRPNTMEGTPESVSIKVRSTLTTLLPGFAYSTR